MAYFMWSFSYVFFFKFAPSRSVCIIAIYFTSANILSEMMLFSNAQKVLGDTHTQTHTAAAAATSHFVPLVIAKIRRFLLVFIMLYSRISYFIAYGNSF